MEKESVFKKVLNTGDVLVVAFGAMIGWGWVVSSGEWIKNGGIIGTVIGFLIGGIMIYFVGLCYAELTTSMPQCGGEHVFSYKAFGKIGAYICTWSIILSYIGVVCYETVSFPTILQYIFPSLVQGKVLYSINGFDIYARWIVVAIIMALIIIVLNIIGTKKAAKFQKILTCVIALVGLLLVAGAVYSGDVNSVSKQAFCGDKDVNIFINIIKVTIMTPFFFFGFDVIPQAAEEINIPLKKVGKMMILSIILAVSFYVLVVLSVGLVMDQNQISESMLSTGLVTADAMAIAFGNEKMSKILIIGGLCGIITSWNSFIIGGSRAIYSLADSSLIPKCFSEVSKKYNTPVNALVLIGLLSVITPFFGRTMLVWVVDAANFACCLAYCIVSMSFLKLRKISPLMNRPFKVKRYKLVGFMAISLSGTMMIMYIIPGTKCALVWQEWLIILGWICLGFFMVFVTKFRHYELKE